MSAIDVHARWLASHRAFHRLIAGGSRDALVVERADGVLALRTPIRPERSLVNAVVYTDADALEAALPELAGWFAEAGIEAWTVWVHVGDEDAAAVCARAGHVLDATPELMWAPLAALDLEPQVLPEGLVLDEAVGWDDVGAINDAAYGLPPDHFAVVMRDAVDEATFRAAVRDHDGRALACAVVNPVGEDAHVLMVATLRDARGRGLATACVRSGLRRAHAAGATTTTLEATALGAPAYERLGYRPLGPLAMWERRVSENVG